MKVGTWAAGVLLVGALGATACGDDDGTFPVGGAGQGGEDVGGSGGSAGSTAVGGGGAGAEAGATPGGAAGTGASAGAAGAAGAGGEGEEPFEVLDCERRPVRMDPEWVRYCTVLSACTDQQQQLLWCLTAPTSPWIFHFFGSDTLPLTAERPYHRFELASCGRDIATCDDVLACAGTRLPGDDCEPDVVAHCDGERAINCGATKGVSDCQRLTGETGACQVIGEGEQARAVCAIAATCSEPGTESCDGDKVVKCLAGGVAEGRDCAEFGLVCEVQGGEATCVPPAPTETCTGTGVASCDDGAITYCNPAGVLYRGPQCDVSGALECGSAGADNTPDRWWDCVPAGCDDTWSGEDPGCEGDSYVFNAGFLNVRVHCPDYGFATCRSGGCSD